MTCRLNCTRKVCGRVRLHVTKTPRRAKPRPIEPATAALDDAMRALTLPPARD